MRSRRAASGMRARSLKKIPAIPHLVVSSSPASQTAGQRHQIVDQPRGNSTGIVGIEKYRIVATFLHLPPALPLLRESQALEPAAAFGDCMAHQVHVADESRRTEREFLVVTHLDDPE